MEHELYIAIEKYGNGGFYAQSSEELLEVIESSGYSEVDYEFKRVLVKANLKVETRLIEEK